MERTSDKVEAGRLDVNQMAVSYIADNIDRQPAYHMGAWWEHTGTCYRQVPRDYMDGRVRLWMRDQGVNPRPAAVANLLDQLRAIVHVDPGLAMPCWIDRRDGDPDPARVVAFRNGLLDVDRFLAGDAALAAHDPRWFSATAMPYAYDPEADCPRWRRCLKEWLEDDEQVGLLQEWCGYCMTLDNSQQKLLMMLGPPRSGRSTTLRMLAQVVGPRNMAAATFASLAGDFGLAELIGRHVVEISEVHADRSARNVVQVLKNITGQDAVPVNRKGLPIVSMTLPVRIIVAANQLPRLPDDSNALRARTLLLHYRNSFLGREDRGLDDELRREAAGVANWALEGLRRLCRRGRFVQPASCLEQLEDFANLAAPIGQFVADCCEVGPDRWEATDDLYHAWRLWCGREGHECCAKNTFGSKLKAQVPTVRNGERRTPGKGKYRVYAGVQLAEDGLRMVRDLANPGVLKERERARAAACDASPQPATRPATPTPACDRSASGWADGVGQADLVVAG